MQNSSRVPQRTEHPTLLRPRLRHHRGMVAQLGPLGEDASRRRYRDLLIESGAIGQRIYLAAESTGLAARNLAAFVDDRLNALLGIDGIQRAAVHLTMLGPGD